MKKISILLLAFLFASCYENERNCTDFRTGKFRFEHTIKGKSHVTIIQRNDSLQLETYQGKTDTAVVRWVSDCEFVLKKTNPKTMKEKQAIAMKILTTSKNSYTFEFGMVGSDAKQKGTVTKLN